MLNDYLQYTVKFTPGDIPSMYMDWQGLIDTDKLNSPLVMSCFGDLFFEDPDGGIYFLDTLEGHVSYFAAHKDEMSAKLSDPRNQKSYLMSETVDQLKKRGLILRENELYVYIPHPAFMEQLDLDTVQVMLMIVVISVNGQSVIQANTALQDQPDIQGDESNVDVVENQHGQSHETNPKNLNIIRDGPQKVKIFFVPELYIDNSPLKTDWAGRILPGQTISEGISAELKDVYGYTGEFELQNMRFRDYGKDRQGNAIERYSMRIVLHPDSSEAPQLYNSIEDSGSQEYFQTWPSKFKFVISNRTNGTCWWTEDTKETLTKAWLLMNDFNRRHDLPEGYIHEGYGTDIIISEYSQLPHAKYEEPLSREYLSLFLERHAERDKKRTYGTILFDDSPYPHGLRIQKFIWYGTQESNPELYFHIDLETEDYCDADAVHSTKHGDWTSREVWENYGHCVLSSTQWDNRGFKAADDDTDLTLYDIVSGKTYSFDTISDDTEDDPEQHAFGLYLLGHDSCANHEITFTSNEDGTFNIKWRGSIALAYAGEDSYDHTFEATIYNVTYAGTRNYRNTDDVPVEQETSPNETAMLELWSNIGQPGPAPVEPFIPNDQERLHFKPIYKPKIMTANWRLDEEAYRLLQLGHSAHVMEDKWNIYMEDDIVHFHRSWTGMEVFRFKVARETSGFDVQGRQQQGHYLVSEFEVEQDTKRYSETDDTVIRNTLSKILTIVLGVKLTSSKLS